MENRNHKKQPVEFILIVGMLLYALFQIVNYFLVEVPKILAYPWLIIACICMFLGIVRIRKAIEERYLEDSDT